MNTYEALLDTIGRTYEAAGDTALWPRALEGIAGLLQATTVSLPIFEALNLPCPSFLVSFNLDPDFPKEYSKYAHLNPYFLRGARFFSQVNATSGEALISEQEFLRTPFYNEFLRRFDVCYHCGGTVLMEPSAVAVLTINRPRRGPPFGEQELSKLRPLMPHLRRALQLQQHFSAIEGQGRALLRGFDALPTGFVLVDPHGKIVLMNRCAEAIVGQNDGLSATAQGLRAARPWQSEKLRQLIVGAARTGAGKGTSAGGAISISRPSLQRPYSVLVLPLRLTVNVFEGAQVPAAAIFVSDPDARREPDQAVLRQLFGFTAAECRLATALLQGGTLQESAELLGISRNTAHAQLRAVFDKTCTHRQVELIRVLGGSAHMLPPKIQKKTA